MTQPASKPESRWPHHLAVVLVCATFPLIWLGGLVTTYDAGMAVPDWPTTYGYNMFLYPWQSWIAGPWDLFIEHGHRLLASLVGLMAIALVVVTHGSGARASHRFAAWGVLALVIFQGLLGGARVVLDSRQVAQIHGIVGPVFFSFCVFVACLTSRWWKRDSEIDSGNPIHVPRSVLLLSGLLLAASFTQLILGSQLRHVSGTTSLALFGFAVRGHVWMALGVLMVSLLLVGRIVRLAKPARDLLHWPTVLLATLVVTQIVLGVGTWFGKYGTPAILSGYVKMTRPLSAESLLSSMLATGHVANGALVMAMSLTVSLRAARYQAVHVRQGMATPVSGAAS